VSAAAGGSVRGMLQASVAAMLLHIPAYFAAGVELWALGSGWRLGGAKPVSGPVAVFGEGVSLVGGSPPQPAPVFGSHGHVAVIDDTTFKGGSLSHTHGTMRKVHPKVNAVFATVYRNPRSRGKPHLSAVELPEPHFLEWNLFNSVYNQWTAYDFDGILCRNPSSWEDDDGGVYQRWMDEVAPLGYFPRKGARLIVTARLERYRESTEAWLRRWRIGCEYLVMGPWESNRERSRHSIARWKAEQLKRHPNIRLYVESEPHLAKQIAAISGVPVLCPAAKWIY
jgi:hypothetical protein